MALRQVDSYELKDQSGASFSPMQAQGSLSLTNVEDQQRGLSSTMVERGSFFPDSARSSTMVERGSFIPDSARSSSSNNNDPTRVDGKRFPTTASDYHPRDSGGSMGSTTSFVEEEDDEEPCMIPFTIGVSRPSIMALDEPPLLDRTLSNPDGLLVFSPAVDIHSRRASACSTYGVSGSPPPEPTDVEFAAVG